jgi:uncharacterized protein YndB with AHSA1/START domain
MTDDTPGQQRTVGTLRATDGTGVVRLEDRFATDVDDLWSAFTDPERLARWLGEVEGDLREGGELRARWFASGWEGTCRIEVCDPPRRILLHTSSADEPDGVVEVTLTPDGDHTVLVLEDRGVPLDGIAAYGAGDQVHVEDLAAYLAGGERCDARARWQQLHPAYERLAARIVEPRGTTA